MKNISGFIRIESLEDRSNDKVAILGELSTYGLSSSIDKAAYSQADRFPGIELVSFRNRGRSTNPVPDAPLWSEAEPVLVVAYWAWQEAFNGFTNNNGALFLQALTAAHGDKVYNPKIGTMLTNGSVWLPEWLSWQVPVKEGETVTGGARIKIWFSNDSFRRQYSQYDIAIVGPVKDLDTLHGNKAEVKALIESRDAVELADEIRKAGLGVPYTIIQAQVYDWIDKVDRDFKVPTSWHVLIWGPAGNNPDVIRDELVDYILDNSKYPRSEWEKILPDLFISTEFIFVPNWDAYALPNQTLQEGIYSPIIKPDFALKLAKRGMPTFSDAHIRDYAETSSNPFKSLGFVACGGMRNRDGVFDFSGKFPQYVAFATTHLDFNRIEPRTQEWILNFNACLKHAEAMTESSEIPEGFARIVRNNIIYCSFSFEKIQYLVVTKEGLNDPSSPSITDPQKPGTYLRIRGGWVLTYSAAEFDAKLEEAE